MNDSEDALAALSWQAAGARGKVCARPQLGSEACSRQGGDVTVGIQLDVESKAAACWLSLLLLSGSIRRLHHNSVVSSSD